ncbi:MAG: GPW/gp25 family protein [Paludibacteraceae bacterium]|nr:GPW/gp25 family protein [Paludibacteraceae bacterium]
MAEDFIGKGWSFPPHFNKYDKSVDMVSGQEEIEQSLKILFSTNVRERLFHPDFGCDLRKFQFAPNNRVTLLHIQQLVETTVRQYEPRIILNNVDINIDEIMDGKLLINLGYTIRKTNTQYNMVYPYYFE